MREIDAAGLRLSQHLGHHSWFQSVGISRRWGPIVYVSRSAPKGIPDVPQEWGGYKVRVERIGKIIPAGDS